MGSCRAASHAGSWYSASGKCISKTLSACRSAEKELSSHLDNWLSNVGVDVSNVKALIAPHAGYRFCGETAAFSYKQVDSSKIKRVFILGPSHHVSLPGCAVTQTKSYGTPLYNLKIDEEITNELLATGKFDKMSLSTDEDEHSIEMHLPYIAKIMQSQKNNFTIIPVLVGSTNHERELMYGKIFSKYLGKEGNLFVISSDFCHWGKRFRFTYHDKSKGHIHESIEHLDKMGMDIIEKLDTGSFYKYLERYSNTICGRHPIGIFLNAVDQLQSEGKTFKFLNYAQSSKCKHSDDSSVSYAAGVFTM